MIHGRVERLQALVGTVIRVPGKADLEIEFVVDTGFEGGLTLPAAAITALGLPYLQDLDATLADDSKVRVDLHIATIVLQGNVLDVPVLAMGKRPLLGAALLAGKELVVQFVDNGLVTVEDV